MSYLGSVASHLFSALLSVVCVLSLSITLRSQSRVDVRRGQTPLEILDSNKDKDGLRGPVRRIRTEVAKVNSRTSPPVEGRRFLLEVTAYDTNGRRVDNETYPVVNSPLGQETYEYDEQGHLTGSTVHDEHGVVLRRSVYSYEFDQAGNWVKMTTSIEVTESGQKRLEPVEVTYRTIAYYPAAAGTAVAEDRKAGRPAPPPLKDGNSDLLVESVKSSSNVIPYPYTPSDASSGAADNLTDVGLINDKALVLPPSAYPVGWRRSSTPINMTVEVVVDETGRVIYVRAFEGIRELRKLAEDAARRAVFLPFREAGRPLKVKGLLNYSFPFTPQ
jgi:YD repeat-containing protein